MHPLLARQIRRYFPDGSATGIPGLTEFLDAVSDSYRNFDDDRVILERSMDISSEELVHANQEMHGLLGKLEGSMSLLRATLDATADGILVVDRDGKLSDYNRKFTEMWRLPESLLKTKDDQKAIQFVLDQLKQPEQFVARIQELYHEPEATSFDVLEFKDGRTFERYSQAQFLGEKVIGRVWGFRDVTERKRYETMFLQSEKMSAVGQLAGGVAHEINNPLGVILGFAQSMKKRLPEDSPFHVPIQHIEREATRCKTLVQDLLTFSRMPTSNQTELTSVNSAIDDAFSLIQAQSRFNTIDVIKDLSENLPAVYANKNQIQQIVINLCGNAIDAMGSGGTLTVRTFTHRESGFDGVAIEISDTGHGIPEEIQKKIFEPFFTTKEVGKGTGLGLSLVYEIVQKHQGRIDLKTAPEKGTTFTVYLPIDRRKRD